MAEAPAESTRTTWSARTPDGTSQRAATAVVRVVVRDVVREVLLDGVLVRDGVRVRVRDVVDVVGLGLVVVTAVVGTDVVGLAEALAAGSSDPHPDSAPPSTTAAPATADTLRRNRFVVMTGSAGSPGGSTARPSPAPAG
ncbi:hypothetical protein GCM10027446_31300 [Angustibacter peucedani]